MAAIPGGEIGRELARLDALLLADLGDEWLGMLRAFPHGYDPRVDVAAEEIQEHTEVETGPLCRAKQLGNVPTPELIGSRGLKRWFLVGRMHQLIAPSAGLRPHLEQTNQAADGAKIR